MTEAQNKKVPKKIYYLSSSHWDREWYKPFQAFRKRLVDTIDGVMDTLEEKPDFTHFTMDGQTSVLDDYVEIRPENRDRLAKLIHEGRISVGPWYTMPDEFLVSGESLIENLRLGHKVSHRFGAEAMKYGYVCDVFGNIAQLPQILSGFGIRGALVGRGVNEDTCPAFFRWTSPDGTVCNTFKVPEILGYGSYYTQVSDYLGITDMNEEAHDAGAEPMTFEQAMEITYAHIEEELARTELPYVVLMDGLDHQVIHPRSLEIVKELRKHYGCPVVYDSLENLVGELDEYFEKMPVYLGELNETGKRANGFSEEIRLTLSSRYDIKKANDETQTELEKWMQPLSAMARLQGSRIPFGYAERAYRYLTLNHAHDSICGCSNDLVHQDMHYRFRQAHQIGEEISDQAFVKLSNINIKSAANPEMQTMKIYNPLPYERHETIDVVVPFPVQYPTRYNDASWLNPLLGVNSFVVTDEEGNVVEHQIISLDQSAYYHTPCGYRSQPGDVYRLRVSVKMPPCGYTVLFIRPCKTPMRYLGTMETKPLCAENKYLRLSINSDGTYNIYHKATGMEYNNLNSYMENSDYGEGWRHVPIVSDVFTYDNGSAKRIEKVSDGRQGITYRITSLMQVPKSVIRTMRSYQRNPEYVTMEIATEVSLGRENNWVDVKTTVKNNATHHRLKALFPTNITTDTYRTSQAFTFIDRKVGYNTESGTWLETDKPENNFDGIVMKRNGDGNGLAVISRYGLHECAGYDDEAGTIGITLFRGVGRPIFTNGQPDGQLLGKNVFEYRLVPLSAEDTNGDAARYRDCLTAGTRAYVDYLPEDKVMEQLRSQKHFSFDSKNLIVSQMESMEDYPDSIAIRVYNTTADSADGVLRIPYEIAGVTQIDLLGNPIRNVEFSNDMIPVSLDGFKIATYRIDLKR